MAKRRRARGSGSVYFDHANGSWVARISLGTRDGKRVGRKVRAASELDAQRELETLRRTLQGTRGPTGETLDDYLGMWLRDHGPSVRGSTRVSYAGHVRMHISPLLGGIPVAKLTTRDVRRLIADRSAAGLSPSTVRRIHATLYMALQQGVKDRTLADNVAAGVDLPRVPEHHVEAMTEDRADAIRDAMRGTFLENLVELLLGSALRLGEALGLDQGDVGEGVVLVRVTKTRIRSVSVSADAGEALRREIAGAKRVGPKEPVFQGQRKGDRLRVDTAGHAFTRTIVSAGLPRLRVHDLRHGAASIMLRKGVDMRSIADQLGHRNPAFTAKVYAHVHPDALAEAVSLLNRRSGKR